MYHDFDLMVQLVLVGIGLYWCVYVLSRLPKDVSELLRAYEKYKTRFDEDVLLRMRTDERRETYQKNAADEFWSTLTVQAGFFWPVTAVVLLVVVKFIVIRILAPLFA